MRNKQKNNSYLIIGIVVLLVFVGVVIVNSKSERSSDQSAYSASSIFATDGSFDFGTVSMKAGNVSNYFELKNEGTEMVKIEKVFTSCMCTSAYIIDSSGKKHGQFGMQGHGLSSKTNIEVDPGESVTLEAIFDPAAHGPSGVGFVERSIYLETNSANSPKLELSFRAMVTR